MDPIWKVRLEEITKRRLEEKAARALKRNISKKEDYCDMKSEISHLASHDKRHPNKKWHVVPIKKRDDEIEEHCSECGMKIKTWNLNVKENEPDWDRDII
jgi:hypothetical protein